MAITDPTKLNFDLCFFRIMVEDLALMPRFYEQAFGFVIQNTDKHAQFEEHTMKTPAGREAILALTKLFDETRSIGSAHVIGILSTDVAAAAANVIACGGIIESELTFPGGMVAMAKDPEGHSIEILHLDGSDVQLPDEI